MRTYLIAPLLALFLVACSTSCAFLQRSGPSISLQNQYDAVWSVYVLCEYGLTGGTGWAVDSRHLITAAHVVDCNGSDPLYVIAKHNESEVTMVVDKISKTYDVSRLVVEGTDEPFKHYVSVNTNYEPAQGNELCLVGGLDTSLVPFMRKCGYIASWNGAFYFFSAYVVPGNSGSPVYDENGKVVGILTMGAWFAGREFFGAAIPIHLWWNEMKPDPFATDLVK